jgi:uncharacterized protein with NRDE domain
MDQALNDLGNAMLTGVFTEPTTTTITTTAPETTTAPIVETPIETPQATTEIPETTTTPAPATATAPDAPVDDKFSWIEQPQTGSLFNDDAKKWFKENMAAHFGTEDPESFLTAHKASQAQLAELTKKSEQWTRREQTLAGLSPVTQHIIQKELKGEAITDEVLGLVGIDLSKPTERQDGWTLLEKYTKGKVSRDQYDQYISGEAEDDVKVRVENYLEIAKDQHQRKVQQYGETLQKQKEAEIQQQAAFSASVDQAIQASIQKYPGLKARIETPQFKEGMVSQNALIDLFFTKDGTYKPNAPIAMAIAEDPEGFVASIYRSAERRATEKAKLEQLKGTPQAPRPRANGEQVAPDPNMPKDPIAQAIYMAEQSFAKMGKK